MTTPDYSATATSSTLPAGTQSQDGATVLALPESLPVGWYYAEAKLDHRWLEDASVGELAVQFNAGVDPSAPIFGNSKICGYAIGLSSCNINTAGPGAIDTVQVGPAPNNGPDESLVELFGFFEVTTAGVFGLWVLAQGAGDLATKSSYDASIKVWTL